MTNSYKGPPLTPPLNLPVKQIIQNREWVYEFVWISHNVKYVQNWLWESLGTALCVLWSQYLHCFDHFISRPLDSGPLNASASFSLAIGMEYWGFWSWQGQLNQWRMVQAAGVTKPWLVRMGRSGVDCEGREGGKVDGEGGCHQALRRKQCLYIAPTVHIFNADPLFFFFLPELC